MGLHMVPSIPPADLAAMFSVGVRAGQTVQDVTETACRHVEEVCNIYTMGEVLPAFEPLCLLNRRLTVVSGASAAAGQDADLLPLPFNEPADRFLRQGDSLLLDGEFLDLSADQY